MTFHTDLKYWGIDKLFLDACCALKHYPEMETRRKEYERSKQNLQREAKRREDENFGESSIARCRKFIWNLIEYPETSAAARVND